MFDDEIWDEDQWEEHLRANDQRLARRLAIFFDHLAERPRPIDADEDTYTQWKEDFTRALLESGFSDTDPLLDMIDEAPTNSGSFFDIGSADDVGIDDLDPPLRPVEDLILYRKALDLSVDLLGWTDGVPIHAKDSTFVHFCANVTQLPANIARGHAFGFEKDLIGGNIACVKRALQAANEGLLLLGYLKGTEYMPQGHYHELYERLFELRNDLGIYVQQLRERFELGID